MRAKFAIFLFKEALQHVLTMYHHRPIEILVHVVCGKCVDKFVIVFVSMLFCYKRTTCDKVIVKIIKIPMDPSSRTQSACHQSLI